MDSPAEVPQINEKELQEQKLAKFTQMLSEFEESRKKLQEYEDENGMMGWEFDGLEDTFMDSYRDISWTLYGAGVERNKGAYIAFTDEAEPLFSHVLEDPNSPEHTALLEFIRFDLELDARRVIASRSGHSPDSPFARENEENFDFKVAHYYPYLARAAEVNAVNLSNSPETSKSNLRTLFEAMYNTHLHQEAQEFILDAEISDEEKLGLVVQYANVNGFMNTIYWISDNMNNPDSYWSDENKVQMSHIYRALQGDNLVNVLEGWVGVYEGYDISDWYSEKLTEDEISFFGQAIAEYTGKDPREAKKIDLAAGTGRHSMKMAEQGWDNIIAAEFIGSYVDKIQQKAKEKGYDIQAKQCDWLNLVDDLGIKDESVDAILLVGRSIMHNGTMGNMLRTFDQIQRALDYNGIAIIDFADPDFGDYKEKIDRMNANYEKLGLEARVENMIFDGVRDDNKFNRLVLNKDQVKALGALVGLKLVEQKKVESAQHGAVNNIYYVLQKDPNFSPHSLGRKTLEDHMITLGYLSDPSSETGIPLNAWYGATIDEAYLFEVDGAVSQAIRREGLIRKGYPKWQVSSNIVKTVRDGVVHIEGTQR